MNYVLERLREPGTLRSLAVVLVAVTGLTPEQVDAYLYLAMALLGSISAFMPEHKVDTAAVAAQVSADVAGQVVAAVKDPVAVAATGAMATAAATALERITRNVPFMRRDGQ